MNVESTEQQAVGLVEPPMCCEICQRFALTEWHCITSDHQQQDRCSAAAGSGYWLCGICHSQAHQIMANHTGEHSSFYAVVEIIDQIGAMVATAPRPYRRKKPADESQQHEQARE